MADKILLEDGVSRLLLEDGVSFLLLEIPEPARAGAINRNVGPALPFTSKRLHQVFVPNSDVTITLTGQSATFTTGTVTTSSVSRYVGRPLYRDQMGPHFDFSPLRRGVAVSPDVSLSLSGQGISTASGTIGPSSSIGLTGQSVSASSGSLTPSRTIGVTGTAVSTAIGTIAIASSVGLTGAAGAYSTGSLSPSMSLGLVGQDGTFTLGTVTVNIGGNLTLALTGQEIGLATGLLVYVNAPALSGQSGAWSAGLLVPSFSVPISGIAGAFATGSLGLGRDNALLGQDVTVSLGTISTTAANDVTLALTGQDISVSTGSLVLSRTNSLSGQLAVFASATIGGGGAILWGSTKHTVFVVSSSGRTKWVHYIPVKYISMADALEVNRYDDAGALGVSTLSSVSGLTEWVDYKPVVIVADTKDWRYDDTGFIRVVEVT